MFFLNLFFSRFKLDQVEDFELRKLVRQRLKEVKDEEKGKFDYKI